MRNQGEESRWGFIGVVGFCKDCLVGIVRTIWVRTVGIEGLSGEVGVYTADAPVLAPTPRLGAVVGRDAIHVGGQHAPHGKVLALAAATEPRVVAEGAWRVAWNVRLGRIGQASRRLVHCAAHCAAQSAAHGTRSCALGRAH